MATVSTTCTLFRLPRELRDKIYDLVFATGDENATIEFTAARSAAPSINLLLTGRRVHEEAEEAYQKSYITFWSGNIFVLPLELKYDSYRITAEDIHHMKRIWMRTVDMEGHHAKGTPYLHPGLGLKATEDDPLNWTVSERHAQLWPDGAGLLRWMKVMSRMTLKSCNEQQSLKKRRLDEIICALYRLEAANAKAMDGPEGIKYGPR